MSFILDALKKSETERQRQSGPALLEMRIVRQTHPVPAWVVIVGLLLIACVAVLGWLAWRPASVLVASAPPTKVPATTIMNTSPAVAQAPPVAARQSVSPAMTTTEQPPAVANPADIEAAVAADPATTRSENAARSLRNYATISGTVPELRLDLHVYAANPAERYAFINMHKVHEGDVTPEGAQVREITREGVVLEFRGSEFLLGRQ